MHAWNNPCMHGSGKLMVKGRSWPPLNMAFAFFVISGEQLPLNVAGDSAKTLSVLENMGGVLDGCGLRFVQIRRRPLKIPPISGSNFEKITGMQPYRNHTKSIN